MGTRTLTLCGSLLVSAFLIACGKNQPPSQPQAAAPTSSTTTESPSVPIAMPPGSVRVNATYNAGVAQGTVGDVGSKILLVPEGHKGNLGLIAFLDGGTIGNDRIKKAGAYFAIVGGDGNANISGVKPGSYTAYLFSGQTKASRMMRESAEKVLNGLTDDAATMSYQKLHIAYVEVKPGQQTEIVNDFGTTQLGQ